MTSTDGDGSSDLLSRTAEALRSGQQLTVVTGPGFDAAALTLRLEKRMPPGSLEADVATAGTVRLRSPQGGCVELRAASSGPGALDLTPGGAAAGIGLSYFLDEASRRGLDDSVAQACAEAFAPATAWLPDPGPPDGTGGGLRSNAEFVRDCARIDAQLSPATRDLCRVLILLEPQRVDRSDDWATLASLVYGKAFTPADVWRALVECEGLLAVGHRDGVVTVDVASPAAAQLLTGPVPVSASEHAALYRALRARAELTLRQADESDRFITTQLAGQAVAGNCLTELIEDPTGVVLSDAYTLAREIERQPGLVRSRSVKAFLLAAHSLATRKGPSRTSYYETSLLHEGKVAAARSLAESSRGRAWRPVWHRGRPVNAHRILAELSSPVLALATADHDHGLSVAACSDGTLWRVAPYEPARQIADLSHQAGEIRACAYGRQGTKQVVVAASSDRSVTAVDALTGDILWRDAETHTAPLSAAAADTSSGRLLVATSGVDGLIATWDALSGAPGPYQLLRLGPSKIPLETRGLAVVPGDPGWIVFSSVDGVVGIARLEEGSETWQVQTELGGLNDLEAAVRGDRIVVALGSSAGHMATIAWDCTERRWEHPRLVGQTGAAINSVVLEVTAADLVMIGGSSDSALTVASECDGRQGTASLDGHNGSVTAVRAVDLHGTPALISGSVDGTIRIWLRETSAAESLALERATRHSGPVSAIRTAVLSGRQAVITGGEDGDLRLWDLEHGTSGIVLDKVLSTVSNLEVVDNDPHRNAFKMVVATPNGALNLLTVQDDVVRQRRPMGISPGGISALSLAPDGDRLTVITGSFDGAVSVWNPLRPDPQVPVARSDPMHFGSVGALAALPRRFGEALCAVGSQDGSLSLRRVTDLSEVRSFALDEAITCIAALPHDDSSLVVGLQNGAVSILRRGSRQTIAAHRLDVVKVAVALVAGRMAMFTAGNDRYVRIWDLETLTPLQEIPLTGLPADIHVADNKVAVASTTGAAVYAISTDSVLLVDGPF